MAICAVCMAIAPVTKLTNFMVKKIKEYTSLRNMKLALYIYRVGFYPVPDGIL